MHEGFYVTVIRGGCHVQNKVGYLAGPYATREEAEAMVPTARALACELDPWCDFDAFGAARVESYKPLPVGKLNDRLGVGRGEA